MFHNRTRDQKPLSQKNSWCSTQQNKTWKTVYQLLL